MLFLCMGAYAQNEVEDKTQLSTNDLTSTYAYKTVSRNWVSIHDPSVVWDPTTQYFYIYGSHYAGVKTKDFKSFSSISNYYQGGYSGGEAYKAFLSNPSHTVKRSLPGNTAQDEVTLGSFDASAFCATYADIQVGSRAPTTEAAWVSGDQWAPDIIYNPHMNKWCLYLSLNGDYWASVIVLLTSDSPTGPFTYEAPIVFGGFDGQTRSGKSVNYKNTDLEIVLGTQSSLPSRYRTDRWGSYYPNCIDPCSFFDEDGELWLAYGSWSGGIFMLKLDKDTGLRDYTYTYSGTGTSPNANATSDAYFGKKIAGGYYVSGEGPYIQHIGDYYYLYCTYNHNNGSIENYWGGSQTIFRSADPMGPYEECSKLLVDGQSIHQGALVETQTGEWWTMLFKDAGAIGRIPYLEPVKWVDGWPVIGNNGTDVSKNGVKYKKPNVGTSYPCTYLPTNDTFTGPSLGLQWQWNHNPAGGAWSMMERPGFMRLHTSSVVDTSPMPAGRSPSASLAIRPKERRHRST